LISTLDLVGKGFVLLVGPDGLDWVAAARDLKARAQLSVSALRLGDGLTGPVETLMTKTGIDRSGAILVRPDGFIAWRALAARADDPAATLAAALGRALCGDICTRNRAA
jgi:putative polyketide hydroxylase